MTFTLSREPHDTLLVTLRDADTETTVAARPASAAATTLRRALADAADGGSDGGYGECFWPGAEGGQYWWIFKRADDAVEVVAMWTRGGAALWEHVFRATDAYAWVRERLDDEVSRLGLDLS